MEMITEESLYPKILYKSDGYAIQTSKGSFLPGIYTDILRAQRAVQGYESRRAASKSKKLIKKEKE